MRSRVPEPEVVLIENDAASDPIVQRVLSRLPNVQHRFVDSPSDPYSAASSVEKGEGIALRSSRYVDGKKVLILKRHRGAWLKACPGTSDHVCCNLFIVNPGEGCPMDCSYCYLQTYLQNNPSLKIYTNTSDLLSVLKDRFEKESSRLFRVGTGELIDSLVWDPLTDATCDFVPFFAQHENSVLELKTKSDYVDNLVDMKDIHKGRTVVSWSVNARSITDKEEGFTASLDERIAAAQRVIEAGYRVGFHFDPVVHFEGWEDEYRDTVRFIFDRISVESVAWVSVSSLRMKPDLHSVIKQRFPESKVAFGEQILASDNKLRYVQPIRFSLTRFVWNELKSISNEMPVYMCMESSAAWRSIAGHKPHAGSEIREVFARNASLPIVD